MYQRKQSSEKTSLGRDLVLILFLSLLLTLITVLFIDEVPDPSLLPSFIKSPLIFLMNYLPVCLLFLILYFATGRLSLSFLVLGSLLLGLGLGQQNKLFYRQDYIRLTDLALLKEAWEMVATGNSIHFHKIYLPCLLGLLALSLLWRKAFPSHLRTPQRILGLGLSLLLAFISLNTVLTHRDTYWNHSMGRYHPYIEVARAKDRGLVYSFFYAYRDFFYRAPDHYQAKEVEEIFASYPESMPSSQEKVDIILILGESFADLESKGAKVRPEVYQSFRALQGQSIHGNMQNYSFGGGTIETERNVLAGLFNHPPYVKNQNTFPWMLKSQSYEVTSMHPFTGTFYNRLNTNKCLGLENFLYAENYFNDYFVNQEGDYFPDKLLFPLVLNHYDQRKKDRPYFNFIATMQNHTPYSSEDKGREDYLDRASFQGDEASYNSANNYLSGIKDTGDQLLKFTQELEVRSSPVVVIFFGDHLARLGAQGEIYPMMGIDTGLDHPQGWLNNYTTPYLIWGNSKAKEVLNKPLEGQGPYMSNFYLFAYGLHELGFKSPYIQYLMDRIQSLPIEATTYNYEEGQLTDKPGQKTLEKKEEFQKVQYYYNTHFLYEDLVPSGSKDA